MKLRFFNCFRICQTNDKNTPLNTQSFSETTLGEESKLSLKHLSLPKKVTFYEGSVSSSGSWDNDTFDIDLVPIQLSKLSLPRSNLFNYPSPTNIDAQFSAINMSSQVNPGALFAINKQLHTASFTANDEASYDEYDAAGLTI
jgi:hypothetical protein